MAAELFKVTMKVSVMMVEVDVQFSKLLNSCQSIYDAYWNSLVF